MMSCWFSICDNSHEIFILWFSWWGKEMHCPQWTMCICCDVITMILVNFHVDLFDLIFFSLCYRAIWVSTMADDEYQTAAAGASETYPEQCSKLRKNGYVMIKDRPCKVVEMSTSKTGKHGHAKVKQIYIAHNIVTYALICMLSCQLQCITMLQCNLCGLNDFQHQKVLLMLRMWYWCSFLSILAEWSEHETVIK